MAIDIPKVRAGLLHDLKRLRRCEQMAADASETFDFELLDIAYEARSNYLKDMRLWVRELGGLAAAW